jgi:hypothetical protein
MDWGIDFTMIPWKYGPGWVHLGFLLQFEKQQADLNTHLDALVKGGVGVESRRSHPSKWHFRSEYGICAL